MQHSRARSHQWMLLAETSLDTCVVCLLLSCPQIVVLDEADRLLDMGFRPAIEAIMRHLPPVSQRQSLMFSATIPTVRQRLRVLNGRQGGGDGWNMLSATMPSVPLCVYVCG
jgi:hypothetical protein